MLNHTAVDTARPEARALGEEVDRFIFSWLKYFPMWWNFILIYYTTSFSLLLLPNHLSFVWLCLGRQFPILKIICTHGSVFTNIHAQSSILSPIPKFLPGELL